ncbi:SH3 domain-containing protein [Agrobacterium sp. P15N1-A]|uniref:SH3 domain-containing protein n=1 Tax=Agrobacterium sp. P15N1-A TaxID=3342820 RepID=UPI0037D33346
MKYSMKVLAAATLCAAGFSIVPLSALAATSGFSTTNLNLRAGPGVRFPAFHMVSAGEDVTIHGCVQRYRWCDISLGQARGWASGAYLQFVYDNRRVYVPSAAFRLGEIPIVSFNISEYWNTYYHDYDFYSELDTWDDYEWQTEGLPPGWHDQWD